MKKDLQNLYLTLFSLGLSIIVYFFVMKKMYKNKVSHNDPLNVKIIDAPFLGKNCCSWLPISHFITFLMWALIWPQYWNHLFALGVGWECVEYLIKAMSTPKGEALKFKRTRTESGGIEYEQWWSSSSKDIVFNAAGLALGLAIRGGLKK